MATRPDTRNHHPHIEQASLVPPIGRQADKSIGDSSNKQKTVLAACTLASSPRMASFSGLEILNSAAATVTILKMR